MPFIDGKSHNFGTLSPFGIWNRICTPLDNIWLESGMLKYMTAYFRPESYTPASSKFHAQYSSFSGPLGVESALKDSVFGTVILRMPVVLNVLVNRPSSKAVMESRAMGCDQKSDSVTMINPRGDTVNCTYSYVPTFSPPMLPNPGSLGILMDYVNATAVAATSATTGVIVDNVQEACVKPSRLSEDYSTRGNKQFCDQSIMLKKYCRTQFPSSLCSGKLRLYIQSVYGGNQIKYQLEANSGGGSPSIKLGLYIDGNSGQANRTTSIGRGSHFLVTYNYHHFLVSSSNLSINPLVPMGLGHRLKKWLQSGHSGGFSSEEINNLEAYLLSTSFPTLALIGANSSAAASELRSYGYPFDFGLNANWTGSSACAVYHKKNADNYRITTLVDVSVSCSGIEDVLNEEMERKCDSLLKEYNVAQGTDFYSQGVNRRYLAKRVTIIEQPDPTFEDPNHKKLVIVGDIEDGGWWYFAKDDEGSGQFNEIVEQKNKSEGGLPYTKECIQALADCLSFSVSAESSTPWMEMIQTDKIFKWDAYYQDYEWLFGCNPRGFYEKCPPLTTAGVFPVYAWYSRSGERIVANYSLRFKPEGDQDGYPPEGMCGPGSDSEMSKIYPRGGFVSGFMVQSASALKTSGDGYRTHKADVSISAGSWGTGQPNQIWAASCGCGFCDGTEEPTCCGGLFRFFTHWVTVRLGEGVYNSEDGNGSTNHFSFLLIPKDDCQALHLGASQSEYENSEVRHETYKYCGNAQKCSKIWWVGTPKVVGADARGWIACGGLYFAKVFYSGGAYDAEGNLNNPDEFATSNWCVFYPGGGEIGKMSCNFRKWGPDGPEDIVVGLLSPWLGGLENASREMMHIVRAEVKGYYILPSGKPLEAANGTGEGRSTESAEDAESQISLTNPYTYLLTTIDIKWPYAGCGGLYNSLSTTNVDGELTMIYGTSLGTHPKQWPFDTGYHYPVGYV